MEATKPQKSFLYDLVLPRVEGMSAAVAILSFVANWYQNRAWGQLLIIGLGGLSIVSFLRAFAPQQPLITDKPYLERITSQELHRQFSTGVNTNTSFFLNALAPRIAGIAGAVILIGTLFKIMFWKGHAFMLLVGTGSILSVLLPMALNQRLNMRWLLLALLGGIMLYTPVETVIRTMYRSDPKLVKLMIYQEQHPHDRAASQALYQYMREHRAHR